MRRFRLICSSKDYDPLLFGEVYNGDYVPEGWQDDIEWLAGYNPQDWQEVPDEPKPLHKDTDLGLFSAMILSEIGNNPNYKLVPKIKLVSESIELAKELIKQLNEETK